MCSVSYFDGVATNRRQETSDLARDLEAKDDEQMYWLWEPGQRERWLTLNAMEQRAHVLETLKHNHATFDTGPKWCFSVDASDESYVAYVDCDLANDRVALGEANISYAAHPNFRGRGYVTRAVLLVVRFLKENTSAREAHIIVDRRNVASLRVAQAVGAIKAGESTRDDGRTMLDHVIELREIDLREGP
jgi:RimJ/RimL family protein N-acetyltransferase